MKDQDRLQRVDELNGGLEPHEDYAGMRGRHSRRQSTTEEEIVRRQRLNQSHQRQIEEAEDGRRPSHEIYDMEDMGISEGEVHGPVGGPSEPATSSDSRFRTRVKQHWHNLKAGFAVRRLSNEVVLHLVRSKKQATLTAVAEAKSGRPGAQKPNGATAPTRERPSEAEAPSVDEFESGKELTRITTDEEEEDEDKRKNKGKEVDDNRYEEEAEEEDVKTCVYDDDEEDTETETETETETDTDSTNEDRKVTTDESDHSSCTIIRHSDDFDDDSDGEDDDEKPLEPYIVPLPPVNPLPTMKLQHAHELLTTFQNEVLLVKTSRARLLGMCTRGDIQKAITHSRQTGWRADVKRACLSFLL